MEQKEKKSFIVFRIVLPIVIFSLAVFFDVLSKELVNRSLAVGERGEEIIDGFFRFWHSENPGAAWSFLADKEWAKTFFLILTPLALLAYFAYYIFLGQKHPFSRVGTLLILAGTVGNYIDRLVKGTVTDFLSFTLFNGYLFPTFNIADSCLCVGVAMLIIFYLFIDKETFSKEKKDENNGNV